MRKIYQIFVLLLLISCSNTTQEKLASNPTLVEVFENSEIQDMSIILEFFNEQICLNQETVENNVIDCYQNFFKRMYQAEKTGYIDLKIPYPEQQKLYNQISDSTFNQIWSFGKRWTINSQDTLKYIEFTYDGKYVNFLKELGEENDVIKRYYDSFRSVGGIGPAMVADLLINYDSYNVKDIRIRLVVAIHYLTMNDQGYRKEKYNNQHLTPAHRQ